MKILAVFMVIMTAFSSQAAQQCRFNLIESSSKIEFIAYKTTQKTPVLGGFKQVTLKSQKNAKNIESLLHSVAVELDASSVESGNELRNKNLKDHFFGLMKNFRKVSARISKVDSGNVDVALKLNGVEKSFVGTYALTAIPDSKRETFELKGEVDVLDFNLSKALGSLNQVCLDLHKGTDGISKTWSTVNIVVKSEIEKNCD